MNIHIKRTSVVFGIIVAATVAITATGTDYQERPSAVSKYTATTSIASAGVATPSMPEISTQNYTGFLTDDTGRRYVENGSVRKSCFLVVMGELYHAGADGFLDTGWYSAESRNWYYFDEKGRAVDGWIEENGDWYYLDDGAYKTGWAVISGADDAEEWYFFDDDGRMLSDCRTPDGYYVGMDGQWKKDVPVGCDGDDFEWNRPANEEPGQISGLIIAGMPAEFYMLSIAGETSGMANEAAVANGDHGRAYGICQFDYRYDLADFMRYAYGKHPDLWPAFEGFLSAADGDAALCGNRVIADAFTGAMAADRETAIGDQLEFLRGRYWDGFAATMNQAGFNLGGRHIAVSAAFFSVNVNCGAQASIFINNLSPDMTDEEMIRSIYRLRNTVLAEQNVMGAKKGTTTRYLKSEPQMALDLLYGVTTIDSVRKYGGGVEWHGNPFVNTVTTVELPAGTAEATKGTEAVLIPTPSKATESDAMVAAPAEIIKKNQ